MNQNARMQLDHDIPAVVVKALAVALECIAIDREAHLRHGGPGIEAAHGRGRRNPRLHRTREEVGVWLVTARADFGDEDASRWPGAKGVRR